MIKYLPFIVKNRPQVTTLGLTSRAVIASDPEIIRAKSGKKGRDYAQALSNWKLIGKDKNPFWYRRDGKIQFKLGPSSSGPLGAGLEELSKTFQNLGSSHESSHGYSTHFSFPERSSLYWHAPDSQHFLPLRKVANFGFDWLELNDWRDAGRLIGYWNGIVATSELDKGFALQNFLADQKAKHGNDPKYNFDCVFFIDDLARNIADVEKAFHAEEKTGKLHLFHFSKEWKSNERGNLPTEKSFSPSSESILVPTRNSESKTSKKGS